MAVEKLSDGIRKFAADAVKLEQMLVVSAPHTGAELGGVHSPGHLDSGPRLRDALLQQPWRGGGATCVCRPLTLSLSPLVGPHVRHRKRKIGPRLSRAADLGRLNRGRLHMPCDEFCIFYQLGQGWIMELT